jgi:hypothetical protein
MQLQLEAKRVEAAQKELDMNIQFIITQQARSARPSRRYLLSATE